MLGGVRSSPDGALRGCSLSELDVSEAVGHRQRGLRTSAVEAVESAGTPALTRADALVLTAAAAVWTAAVGALAVWRHNQFLSHRFDLGNMVQAVWSSAHGRPLEMTDGATGEQIVRLAAHVDPALLLLVPFWWVHPAPETLVVVQAAALAAGVYPVARLALEHLGSRLAAWLLCAWYLAFPWVLWNAVNDFHPVTIAIPLLLYAIWFLDQHHLGRFAAVAGVALLTGELVGLTIAGIGVWYALSRRRYRAGLGIAVAGASWTAVCLTFLIPAFHDGPNRYYSRFESVGGSPTGLARTLVTDPGAVIGAVTTGADLRYVALLLLPTALIALGAPLLLVAAIPQLGVNLLSDWWSSTQPQYQYVAPILAPLIAATVIGVSRVRPRFRPVYAALPLAAALICVASMPPLAGEQGYVFGTRESAARLSAMQAAVASVPETAAVTATNRLGAHLSTRRAVYLFPERKRSDWLVVDTRDRFVVVGDEEGGGAALQQRAIADLEKDKAWRLVFDRVDVRVYRRIPAPSDAQS
jgi:uncharacterized membrane protein